MTEVGEPTQIAPEPQQQPLMPGMSQTPMTDPNQVTTKPRQMPGDGAPGGQIPGIPGEQPMPGQGFDPTAMGEDGADSSKEGKDLDDDFGPLDENAEESDQAAPKVAAIARDVLRSNPGMPVRQAIRLAARAHHLSAPEGDEGIVLVAAPAPERPRGQGDPREPAEPMRPGVRTPEAGWGVPEPELANSPVPVGGTAWEERNR